MDFKKALEEVEKTLYDLQEENKTIPIVVEGEKDVEALQLLGVRGVILPINQGRSLTDFCDWLAERFEKIIILTDWDRHGGILCRMMIKQLRGRIEYNTSFRKIFAKYTMIRTVEGLPGWLKTMRNRI